MDRTLIKKYIDSQPQKVVAKLDLDKNKIEYQGILQGQVIKEIKGDEEMSRSFILTRLINELGYSPDRIEIEHEYTAGRPHTNTSRIDIIVRDADGNAFLFIECKSPDAYNDTRPIRCKQKYAKSILPPASSQGRMFPATDTSLRRWCLYTCSHSTEPCINDHTRQNLRRFYIHVPSGTLPVQSDCVKHHGCTESKCACAAHTPTAAGCSE